MRIDGPVFEKWCQIFFNPFKYCFIIAHRSRQEYVIFETAKENLFFFFKYMKNGRK